MNGTFTSEPLGTSRNLTFHEWNLDFGTSRNLTFHEWNLHFGTGSIPSEPLGTWCKVSGGCPKPPRSFIGRTPSLSGCWGKKTETTLKHISIANIPKKCYPGVQRTKSRTHWFSPTIPHRHQKRRRHPSASALAFALARAPLFLAISA